MRLHVLFTGEVRRTGAPVLAYLIRTGETDVLVDTGYTRERVGAYRDDPDEPIRLDDGEDVLSRLAELGIAPDDVGYVICTHFDPDHAGNHDAFPGAEFVVQRRHYEWARSVASPRLAATRELWDRPDHRYRLIDGDVGLLPGIELIESSGHVPGHQSVLVRLAGEGPILLAADAIPTTEALDPIHRPIYPLDMDEAEVRASTEKLTALARSEGAQIIHGHDAVAAKSLRAFPSFYS
ncbi:N-acyl homoserine lactonase family protein [Actinoallomurus sp. NPDC052274]|uniref:N-acyl homoserine lactonase family protein n=1 Tax=Actinoallomurus sp. NPDC052274 TaxID=3155420 RepID=UPI00341C6797